MCERFSFFNKAFVRFLLCISFFFLTSCEGGPPTFSVEAAPLSACKSLTPGANPYLSHETSEYVNSIYESYKGGWQVARQDAFSYLGKNMNRWSDYEDIAVDDSTMIRITITYLDPVLVQYIILNHVLSLPMDRINNNEYRLDNLLQSTMTRLGSRNELLFMITITSPFYREQAYNSNVLTVNIPIEQMTLLSASGVKTLPTSEDYKLTENIDITHGPISGIVGYPVSVLNQDTCINVTDLRTTSFTLKVKSLTLGDTLFPSQSWSITYDPLILQDNYHPTPTIDPFIDTNRFSKSSNPPTPNWRPNAEFDNTVWEIYWEEMGRYIWDKVVLKSGH